MTEATSKPAIFRRWPGLTLPHLPLGRWPTPVRPLAVAAGGARVWVKDEGACAEPYGGNKVRKLELSLADAKAKGYGDVLTIGAVGSHHVLATALYARRAGLRTYAVLFPQPDTPHVRANARLIDAWCEGWIAASSWATIPWAYVREWLAIRTFGRRSAYTIAAGGSDALGTAGWVSAGLEIAEAVAEGTLPTPARVYVALGSGGSAAGLLLGLRVAGLPTEVVAVRVVDRVVANAARVRRLAAAARRVLIDAGADVPDVPLDGLRVAHDWFGRGYGHVDDRGRAADAEARGLGLAVEGTYTGKTFGCAVDEARRRGVAEDIVIVHTVNTQPLQPLLAEALPEVPERMRGLLR